MGVSNLLAGMQLNICDLLHFIPLTERGKYGLFLKHSMPLVSTVCVFDINNFFIVWYLSWPLNDKDEHETNSSNYTLLRVYCPNFQNIILFQTFTGRNEVVAKVMFLLVSVILSTGGYLAGRTPRQGDHPAGRPPWQGGPPGRRPPPPAGNPPARRTPWAGRTLPVRRAPSRETPRQGDPRQGDPSRENPRQGDPLARRPCWSSTDKKNLSTFVKSICCM